MAKLTKKKRRWIVNQFRSGRSPTQIAKIQKVSRQTVYDFVAKHKKEGVLAYETKQPGRKKMSINNCFIQKVVKIRNEDDYGS